MNFILGRVRPPAHHPSRNALAPATRGPQSGLEKVTLTSGASGFAIQRPSIGDGINRLDKYTVSAKRDGTPHWEILLEVAHDVQNLGQEHHGVAFARVVDAHLALLRVGLHPNSSLDFVGSVFEPSGFLPEHFQSALSAVEFHRPKEVSEADLKALILHSLEGPSEKVGARVRQGVRELSLTGDLDGFSKLRHRLKNDVEQGRLEGEPEELFVALEARLERERLVEQNPARAVARAYSSLFAHQDPDLEITQEIDGILVGDSLLPRRD